MVERTEEREDEDVAADEDLDDLEPTTLMAGRCLVATLFLLSIMVFTGALGKLRRAGRPAFALGVINSALPFTLIA